MHWRDIHPMIYVAIIMAAGALLATMIEHFSHPDPPRLVAFNCDGQGDTSQPLYADEEDAFPLCEKVLPNPQAD